MDACECARMPPDMGTRLALVPNAFLGLPIGAIRLIRD
jgi:hypothetical protein